MYIQVMEYIQVSIEKSANDRGEKRHGGCYLCDFKNDEQVTKVWRMWTQYTAAYGNGGLCGIVWKLHVWRRSNHCDQLVDGQPVYLYATPTHLPAAYARNALVKKAASFTRTRLIKSDGLSSMAHDSRIPHKTMSFLKSRKQPTIIFSRLASRHCNKRTSKRLIGVKQLLSGHCELACQQWDRFKNSHKGKYFFLLILLSGYVHCSFGSAFHLKICCSLSLLQRDENSTANFWSFLPF